jgi:hypothetical protein
MVVVEPLVSEEKLRQLLDEQAESVSLDYKSACDLRDKGALVELAKDVAAMEMHGGFIVIGADDRGQPVGGLQSGTTRLFDEAALRAKLRKWIPEPLDLLTAHHEVAGSLMVMIYVGPNPQGLAIFQADGQYVDASGQQRTAFRKGDVFARHGTASEPWSQSDLRHVLERVVAATKEEWRRELAADFVRLGAGSDARRLAMAPASALSWNLDAASFEAAIIEQIRTNDDIPLKLLLERLPEEVRSLARSEQRVTDLPTLFDRVICVAALGLRLDRPSVVEAAIEATGSLYEIGFEIQRGPAEWAITSAAYWLELVERVMGLGGLAVRLRRWDVVRTLALRRGDADDWRYWRSWLRHGLTMAARSRLLVEDANGSDVERSLLSLAHRVVAQNEFLRPGLSGDDERILDSLCQFDALAALAVISETGSLSGFYPNFSRFYSSRTVPAIARLISDAAMRQAIFPKPDAELADALRGLDAQARQAAVRFNGWGGYDDERIRAFLRDHPDVTSPA